MLFRSIAMSRPDPKMIIDLLFASKGFSKSAQLARFSDSHFFLFKETLLGQLSHFFLFRQLSSMFEICTAMLSKQPHYEFGLRSIKSVIQLSISMKASSTMKSTEEEVILFNAVHRMKFSELLPEDQTLFLRYLGC